MLFGRESAGAELGAGAELEPATSARKSLITNGSAAQAGFPKVEHTDTDVRLILLEPLLCSIPLACASEWISSVRVCDRRLSECSLSFLLVQKRGREGRGDAAECGVTAKRETQCNQKSWFPPVFPSLSPAFALPSSPLLAAADAATLDLSPASLSTSVIIGEPCS